MITKADLAACEAIARDDQPAILVQPPAVGAKRLFVDDPIPHAMIQAVNWIEMGSPELARLVLLKALHVREL
jgi:hypothetical protein